MTSGIDLNAVIDFTLPHDKADPTVWKVSAVPSSISGQLALMTGGMNWKSTIDIIRVGLKGFENFKIKGKKVEASFAEENIYGKKMKVISMDTFDSIPPNALLFIFKEIMRLSRMQKEDQKN